MNNERLEQILTQNLTPETPDKLINERLKAQMANKAGKDNNMKKFSIKKAAIMTAAACLAVGAVSVAYTGATYKTAGSRPNEFTSYDDLSKAESKAGIDVKAVERFANGYTFNEMSITHNAEHTEEGTVVARYDGISISYEKEGADTLHLDMEAAEHSDLREDEAAAQTEIDGINVKYYVDTYKWVPAGYELTDEDQANLEKGNYYISSGADEISENKVCHAVWEQDGITYILNDIYGYISADELFAMAAEIIAQ